jgi:lipopolysaccharide/colanic/teichoic acid biosynthesis glycosyltransferase
MSLVGPRPALPYEAGWYAPWHMGRFEAIPGMTGLWQVSGKNRLTFDEMVRLDIQYIIKKSPLMDLWILLRTPLAIVEQIKETLGGKGDPDVSSSSIDPMVETRIT